ncbi:ABC transporter ATP-binding protein [Virgibacillus sp. NKC19-3]|uniref:ABC transporter ATP-binding protein n=1 Tax=Virgibacillus saliphilus TaxID=2831674 RepID=UPI001C9AE54E|nr:ABC transporter ATP-binding protein [Virgibacillus sp. NKC19-3]MBY7144649.1 ABC transporter ATP-binding protein [Virgibacillus sp. NKC19-3]
MSENNFLELKNVCKYFDDVKAVDNISISIKQGELVSFIGPSGCGKTTLLRTIGGFNKQDAGEIILDNEKIDAEPPEKRSTGMVFQNYALFPHMTVYDNVGYGLKQMKIPKKDRDARIRTALSQVELDGYGERKPAELSGGQQQRVAIARCLVLEPKVLLLDEPLSNLDANLRISLREEIRKIKDKLNLTVIFVTHDQEEALSISDRIAVLNGGVIHQLDSSDMIYNYPRNKFVSTFVGQANFFTGRVQENENGVYLDTGTIRFPVDRLTKEHGEMVNTGEEATVLVRPEQIKINASSSLKGKVTNIIYNGNFTRYFIDVENEEVKVDDFNSFNSKKYQKDEEMGIELPKAPHMINEKNN